MAVNLLGDESTKISKARSAVPVKMHQPEEQKVSEQKEAVGQISISDKVPFREAKLYSASRWKKRLTFAVVFVIIILGGILASTYYFIYYNNINTSQNINLPVISNVNNINTNPPSPPVEPPQPPIEPPQPPVQPLPDTELTPLRGALVKFANESAYYLIEDNGELRKVDLKTVIFRNGQTINQISNKLIYSINDRYKNIRQGKDVVGQVDWDPRVVNTQELKPFL